MNKNDHARANGDNSDKQKREISGNIHIPGEVKVQFPKSLVDDYAASSQQSNAREDRKFLVDRMTLIFVILAFGLTVLNAWFNYQLTKTAQNTFESSNRAYVGFDHIGTLFVLPSPDGNPVTSQTPTDKTIGIELSATFKNYGTVPAEDYVGTWRVFIDGAEMRMKRVADSPGTLFPTETVGFRGQIGTDSYNAIANGRAVLQIKMFASYSSHKRTYKYCNTQQYDPQLGGFLSLGTDCPKN